MTTVLPPSSFACLAPRFGTKRRPERLTHGSRQAEIGQSLGKPFMPWQRYVADVAGEIDPETNTLYYNEVVILVPRQSGKTTIGLSVRVERALGFGERQTLLYTAQTHGDARKKWEDEHWPLLQASPLASLVRKRARNGSEAFVWANGSVDGIVAPTEKAAHGMTLDLGFADEAFAAIDDRLEQAFGPAMITRPEPQLWIVSTAGTPKSAWLRGKVDAGRRRLTEDPENALDHRTAYFEWSAPDDADPLDPAVWRACMPALGFTITERAIQNVLDRMLAEHGIDGLGMFRRAYLNQWPDTYQLAWRVIPELVWKRCGGAADEYRPSGDIAFGVDSSWPDGEFTTISVATQTDTDELYLQVLDRRPGTAWVVPILKKLVDKHQPHAVVIDPKSPAGHLITAADAAGIDIMEPSMTEIAHASLRIKLGVTAEVPTVRHYDQGDLNDAVAQVSRRPLADAWTWARKNDTDISPLTSATLAVHGLTDAGGLQPWAMTL